MLNRRGFLAALAGGAAVAADPERLLWRKGAKLISIPRALFVGPQYHIFGADMEIPSSLIALSEDGLRRYYIDPAVKVVQDQINRVMLSRYELLALELPRGCERAETLPNGFRMIAGYDVSKDRRIMRVDALVKARA